MADFSWSDGVQAAFSSCLVCFRTSPESDVEHQNDSSHSRSRNPHLLDAIPPARARPDELQGLLADADDADTMSLHSNIGDPSRRKKRRRPRKGIRFFGVDLFGRPPVHLSDSEDDAPQRTRTISSSTLDSDASPLDPSAINELTAARQAAASATAAAEEERRKAKEERRALRRERKELRRAAMEMGLSLQHGEEFQGFQGSGGDSPYRPGAGSASYSGSQPGSPFVDEEFGPFAASMPPLDHDEEADADGADFGAESYARRIPRGSSSGGGSDTRSRTSGSASNSGSHPQIVFNHHQLSQQPSPLSPTHAWRKSASRRGGSSRLSESSHSNNSHSLPSPSVRTPQPVGAFDSPGIATPPYTDEPHDEFDGVPGGGLEERSQAPPAPAVSGFPSVGLRGPGMQRMKSDMGVFLANRGEA